MPDIHIQRDHALGRAGARRAALAWAAKARDRFAVTFDYVEGAEQDVLRFARPGVDGTLQVGSDAFDLRIELGLLMGVLKNNIEREIAQQFDTLLNATKTNTGRSTA